MKTFVHDEERKPEQTTCFYLLTDSGTKPLDDLLEKIADGLAKNDKCKNIEISGCKITEDCLQLTCSTKVIDKEISLKMKVNRYVYFLYLRTQFSLQSFIFRFVILRLKTLVMHRYQLSFQSSFEKQPKNRTVAFPWRLGQSETRTKSTNQDVRNVGGARIF